MVDVPCTYVIPSYDSSLPAVGYNTAVKQTIFAVEDDTDISRLVRHHLEAAGYAVLAPLPPPPG